MFLSKSLKEKNLADFTSIYYLQLSFCRCPYLSRFSINVFRIIQCLLTYLQVASGQVASTGMVALSYVQKISEKVLRVTSILTTAFVTCFS